MKKLTWKNARELALKVQREIEERREQYALEEARRTSSFWDKEIEHGTK